ncbi:MAG: hypothetical protein IKG21_12865 [Atopobiaceae bacterium]|nr:hypothetical protein [Atopobiaceae bacterium]
MSMSKVTHVRQALEQICSDARNPRTMCAHIMAEHGVTIRDVLDACDMARDVVVAWREPRVEQERTDAQALPTEHDAALRAQIERDKTRALGQVGEDRHAGLSSALAALRGEDG